jgi:transposase
VSDVGPAVTRKLGRSKMHEFFSQIEPSLIGMEACGSAHYWEAMGHEVLLMPPAYTKPYVKRGKNDAVDADACFPSVFKSGHDFAAWLGLTPRQNSSGGKQALGAITKQGNRYIRKLLVLGATSLLNVVGKRKGALRDWIVGLLAKKPARLVTVALANKLARILWAMMKTGESFRTELFAKA